MTVKRLAENVVFGENDTHELGLQISLDEGTLTPKEIWETKDEWYNAAQTSRDYWENDMEQEQREALLRMITGALARMHDRVEDWVPEGLSSEGGKYLDVTLRILFTDIDQEIDRHTEATLMEIEDAATNTRRILKEIREAGDDEETPIPEE